MKSYKIKTLSESLAVHEGKFMIPRDATMLGSEAGKSEEESKKSKDLLINTLIEIIRETGYEAEEMGKRDNDINSGAIRVMDSDGTTASVHYGQHGYSSNYSLAIGDAYYKPDKKAIIKLDKELTKRNIQSVKLVVQSALSKARGEGVTSDSSKDLQGHLDGIKLATKDIKVETNVDISINNSKGVPMIDIQFHDGGTRTRTFSFGGDQWEIKKGVWGNIEVSSSGGKLSHESFITKEFQPHEFSNFKNDLKQYTSMANKVSNDMKKFIKAIDEYAKTLG